MPTSEALNMARTAGMDLVEVSPQESPPVCRIMDYGKFKYTQKKKQKQSHAVRVDLKEVRLRPKTDDNDRMIKVNHALEFLDKGHKVQFTMLFKGRERFNMEFAMSKFREIIAAIGEKGKVIRAPLSEGKRMTMIIVPAKHTGP